MEFIMARTFETPVINEARARKGAGFLTSFFAAVRTANAIEAGLRPSARDLATLDIASESLPRLR